MVQYKFYCESCGESDSESSIESSQVYDDTEMKELRCNMCKQLFKDEYGDDSYECEHCFYPVCDDCYTNEYQRFCEPCQDIVIVKTNKRRNRKKKKFIIF